MVLRLVSLWFVFSLISCKQGFDFSTIPDLKDLRQLQTDTFIQTKSGQYDFLWVVDNSGSMEDEQETLIEEFETFIAKLSERQYINYQMGVVTTDMILGKGELVKNTVVKVTDSNPVEKFTGLINSIGIRGSGTEEGFAASLFQLSKPVSALMRTDVPLVLIYVTDEDDHSGSDATEEKIIKHLKSLHKNVQVYSIVTPINSNRCNENYFNEAGTRYVSLVGKINQLVNPNLTGTTLSICPSELAGSFRAVAQSLSEAGYVFPLSQENPVGETLEVQVAGTKLQSTGPSYYFDNSRNSIVFRPGYQPSLNQEITVKYEY